MAGTGCAIKVFKTSILVFKDRDKYVTGEFRFRRGYCKSNPRKMVRLWAEKEYRNLNRSATSIITLLLMLVACKSQEYWPLSPSSCALTFW
jgi:serine/threonine-protein kinase RIO1